jgi:2-keto-3-deoxy-6-phosphogluconate aldolase
LVGCVAVGLDESVVRKEFVEKENWQAITDIARQYVHNLPRRALRPQR